MSETVNLHLNGVKDKDVKHVHIHMQNSRMVCVGVRGFLHNRI